MARYFVLSQSDTLQSSNDSEVKEIAEFEKKESEYLSAKDLVGKSGIVLKILDEIVPQRTDFGPSQPAW